MNCLVSVCHQNRYGNDLSHVTGTLPKNQGEDDRHVEIAADHGAEEGFPGGAKPLHGGHVEDGCDQ